MSLLASLSDAVAEFIWTSAAVAVGAVLAFVLPRTLGRIAHIAESAGWDVHGSWRRRQRHPDTGRQPVTRTCGRGRSGRPGPVLRAARRSRKDWLPMTRAPSLTLADRAVSR